MTELAPVPAEKVDKEKAGGKKNRLTKGLSLTAKVLSDNGMGQREIARELNVPLSSLQLALKKPTYDKAILEEIKRRTPATLYAAAFRIAKSVDDMTDEEIKRIPINIRAVTLGIMIEKARLMEGESTEIFGLRSKAGEIDAKNAEVTGLIQRIRDSLTKDGTTT